MTNSLLDRNADTTDGSAGQMRAYALDEFGHAGSIHVLPIPEPAAGEVLVRLRAASLNAFDCSIVAGRAKDYMEHRFPLVPALDGAGTIERLGDGVTGFSVGDEVFGLVQRPFMGQGTLAEHQTEQRRHRVHPLRRGWLDLQHHRQHLELALPASAESKARREAGLLHCVRVPPVRRSGQAYCDSVSIVLPFAHGRCADDGQRVQ